MNSFLSLTNPTRIYRSYPDRKHDLSVLLQHEDIYGEDTWCNVDAETESLVFDPSVRTNPIVVLWYETGIDIEPGYLVEVKEAMYLAGRLVAVETTLSANAAIGASSLSVASIYGFESGHTVLLTDGTVVERAKIKSVGTTIVLYADMPLETAWDAGDTVRASNFYEVTAVFRPGGLIKATAVRTNMRNVNGS